MTKHIKKALTIHRFTSTQSPTVLTVRHTAHSLDLSPWKLDRIENSALWWMMEQWHLESYTEIYMKYNIICNESICQLLCNAKMYPIDSFLPCLHLLLSSDQRSASELLQLRGVREHQG